MIEFVHDGKPIARFDKFMFRYGNMFLMRLTRIEYSSAKGGIFPVYTQVFDWSVRGGQAALTLYVRNVQKELLAHVFTFQGRAPFFGYSCYLAETKRAGYED
jgi:hypothetical protein